MTIMIRIKIQKCLPLIPVDWHSLCPTKMSTYHIFYVTANVIFLKDGSDGFSPAQHLHKDICQTHNLNLLSPSFGYYSLLCK